jgi:hypothetical protein
MFSIHLTQRNQQNRKRTTSKEPNTKVTTSIMCNMRTTTKEAKFFDSENYERNIQNIHENQLLKEAVCNAIQTMHKDISIYIKEEEKEKEKEMILSNETKYLNILKPLRPITYMIIKQIQNQRLKYPLRVLMDTGYRNGSFIYT